jgi:predicted nucleic acid-binding protein
MPSFVPDASVTLPWCFEDERTAFTESLLNRIRISESVIVPGHWPVEILNSLIQAKKRGRVPEEKIRRFLQDLSSFPILVDNERSLTGWERVRHLAETHRLTAYDAAYLELAQRTGLPLATLDGDLRKAALAESAALLAET